MIGRIRQAFDVFDPVDDPNGVTCVEAYAVGNDGPVFVAIATTRGTYEYQIPLAAMEAIGQLLQSTASDVESLRIAEDYEAAKAESRAA